MKEKFVREENSQMNIGEVAKKIYDKTIEGLTPEEIEKYNEALKTRIEDKLYTGIEFGTTNGRNVSNNWELYSKIEGGKEEKTKRR